MTEPVLRLEQLNKSFAALQVTQAVSLDVHHGEIHALIGPNGAGKSSLVAQIAGQILPDSGRILLRGSDISNWSPQRRARHGLAQTFQVARVFRSMTVLENVAVAVNANRGRASAWRRFRANDTLNQARQVLERLGFDGINQPAEEIAYGTLKQLELAMGLAGSPSVLLLDEPLAGLSRTESTQVIELLRGLRPQFATLLIEHDMDAVFALADRVSVLVSGKIIASGTPESIRNNDEVRRSYLGND